VKSTTWPCQNKVKMRVGFKKFLKAQTHIHTKISTKKERNIPVV